MALIDALRIEVDEVFATKFWKLYYAALRDKKDFETRNLITSSDKEKLPSIQASIRMLEWVEGLPKKVLEDSTEK